MYKAPEETLAERLLRMIHMNHDSISSFAKACGLGESLVRKYLAGSQPSAANLLIMADSLCLTMDWLAAGRQPMIRSLTPEHEALRLDLSFESIMRNSFSKMNSEQKGLFMFLLMAQDNPGMFGREHLADSFHTELRRILNNIGLDLIPLND